MAMAAANTTIIAMIAAICVVLSAVKFMTFLQLLTDSLAQI
jgi:hypothetical protein